MTDRMSIELDIPKTAAERIAQQDTDRECQCPKCGRLHRHLRAGVPPNETDALALKLANAIMAMGIVPGIVRGPKRWAWAMEKAKELAVRVQTAHG